MTLDAAAADPLPAPPVPTAGRIVHYVNNVNQHLPAMVVRAWDDYTADLFVMDVVRPTGESAPRHAKKADDTVPVEAFATTEGVGAAPMDPSGEKAGTWHWPERA